MRIMITGGGTGGHVYPALTIAQALLDLGVARPDELLFVGTAEGMEARLVPQRRLPFATVPAAPVAGRAPWQLPGAAVTIGQGVRQARELARRLRPAAILATGGFVSVPAVLGARLEGVPSVIYLPDMRPGIAVRFLSRFARRIAVTTETACHHFPPGKVEVTGYPVRSRFGKADQEQAREDLGLDPGIATVLVLGGSQGARSINFAIRDALPALLETAQLIHVSGPRDYETMAAARARLEPRLTERYRLDSFLDAELPDAFAAASLVVSRAGASILGELTAAGRAALLVPYAHAGGHQAENAAYLAAAGAAEVVDDEDVASLAGRIAALLGDPGRLAVMASAASGMAQPDAANRIARMIARVGGGGEERTEH